MSAGGGGQTCEAPSGFTPSLRFGSLMLLEGGQEEVMGLMRGHYERHLDPLSLQPFWMPYCCSRETGKGPGKTPEL